MFNLGEYLIISNQKAEALWFPLYLDSSNVIGSVHCYEPVVVNMDSDRPILNKVKEQYSMKLQKQEDPLCVWIRSLLPDTQKPGNNLDALH